MRSILGVLLILCFWLAQSQELPLSFHHIGTADGLSNPINPAVYKDSRGFVWIASIDGLNRFDGQSIKVYRPDPGRTDALQGNIISSNFYEDTDANLWFTTYGAVHCYVRKFDHFRSWQFSDHLGQKITEDYRAFHLDSTQRLWVRTGLRENGILHWFDIQTFHDSLVCDLDGQRNTCYKYGPDEYLVLSSMFAQKPGIELLYLDGTQRRRDTLLNGSISTEPELMVFNVHIEDPAHCYLGTAAGLGILDLESSRFELIDQHKDQSLGQVWSVYPLMDSLLLVGSQYSGLLIYDPAKKRFISQHLPATNNEFSLRQAHIREVYSDHDDGIWVSMWGEGLAYASAHKNKFAEFELPEMDRTNLQLASLVEDLDGHIHIGTSFDGIYTLDEQSVVVDHTTLQEIATDASGGRLENLYLDRKQRLWTIIQHAKNGEYYIYQQTGPIWHKRAQAAFKIFSMQELPNGRMLLATRNGIQEIGSDTDDLSLGPCPELRSFQNQPFYRIFLDQDSVLYFTANFDRILSYTIEGERLQSLDTMQQVGNVMAFLPTRDSILWVAGSSGLMRINRRDRSYRRMSQTNDGVPNEAMYMVFGDSQERLWLRTQNGLLRYDPWQKTIRRYNRSDGVPDLSEEPVFLQTQDGEIWMGDLNRIVTFQPEEVTDLLVAARPQITGIYANAEPLDTDTFATEIQQITLPYQQNTVAFDFVACEYSDPDGARFRYRMIPFEEEWVQAGNVGFARYANLPSGAYTFSVQASNSDGLWSPQPAVIKVSILPPWWQTWWARLMYLLLGVAALYGLYSWRTREQRRKLAQREMELVQERTVNERLRQVDELKDQFLANTSHELRTPLIGIIGVAESLMDGATGPITEDLHSNLSLITSSGKRLAHLVDDILDFSRIKNEDLKLNLQHVDLQPVAEIVLTLLAPLAKSKGLHLQNLVARDLPLVEADENRIQQVLFNLVGNAIKFTDQGQISLESQALEDHVAITVRDTGIGIPSDQQERIFMGFQQVDGSDTRGAGGTGLGLTLARQLVKLHGGTLTVASKPGQGSAFTFTLPTSTGNALANAQNNEPIRSVIAPMETQPLSTAPPKVVTQNDIRILIVDDEPVNLQVLYHHLALAGYQVTQASSGSQALEILEYDSNFDLMILDVMMPRMSGFEVCQQLRQRFLPSELPIVLLTAKNQIADLVAGFDAGANDYLQKPFSRDELLSRIRTHLRLHRIHKATGKFVPYEFLHSIGRDEITEVKLGDQAYFQHVSVLFADIRDYTTLSEQMTPQQNFKFVNAFVGRIGPVIERHGGFVNQYLGDAIMAIFPDDNQQAVEAAIGMQQTIDAYNQERTQEGREPLSVGIGIHTGPLIMGIIGYFNRTDTSTIADSVNIASRLEGLTKYFGARILISEACKQHISDQNKNQYRYLGKVQMKGKSEAIGIYECLEGDSNQQRQKKLQTLSAFSQALTSYHARQFNLAADLFQHVIKVNPSDRVALHFHQRSQQYQAQGVPADWQGVETMQIK